MALPNFQFHTNLCLLEGYCCDLSLYLTYVIAACPFWFYNCRNLNGFAGAIARRRLSIDKPVATEVRTKPGALQTIFNLPPDEVHRNDHINHCFMTSMTCEYEQLLNVLYFFQIIENSFSCAMERSFLYQGRMYVSASNICFHSNVFAKQLKVVLETFYFFYFFWRCFLAKNKMNI